MAGKKDKDSKDKKRKKSKSSKSSKNKAAAKRPGAKESRKTQAQRADKYSLYLQCVQSPDVEVSFFERAYKYHYGRRPLILREDFCGTFGVCAEWVKSRSDRTAIGVDIDPKPLAWGHTHHLEPLAPALRDRIEIVQDDVREYGGRKADVIAAENFSYWYFKTRAELVAYFEKARENLAKEGVFVLDLMGGMETQEDDNEEITEHDGFDYVWELIDFDPVSYHCHYAIRFRFPDGSELQAFDYQWRHWTIPEVRELLAEAGFTGSHVYWEGTDRKTGEGNGVYLRRDRGDADPAWISYVVAYK